MHHLKSIAGRPSANSGHRDRTISFRELAAISALLVIALGVAPRASAYPQYSETGSTGDCATCHGDFRTPAYISLHDHQNWGNLHDLHRSTMLSGDCNTCHYGAGRFPVYTEHSNGGDGLAAISCVGCHGRAEDNVPQNPEVAAGRSGYGAGLRQHHHASGVTDCAHCHLDANPAQYTAVGESVKPAYYAHPGNNHPYMPTDACNGNGSEDFAGAPDGLDNDGDRVYDMSDSDCSSAGAEDPLAARGSGLLPNHPNPFPGGTTIEYVIAADAVVDLRVVDVNGRLVRRLAASRTPGRHMAEWDGRDDAGRAMSSGLYFSELRVNGVRTRRAMVLVR